jgi:roadblock/LC7 domain-containing protein
MAIKTIDDVILALDAIIQRAWHEQDRIGYFAALYRRVTRAVKDGIAHNQFANGPLMEKLDVVFAGRYLDAQAAYEAKHAPSRSWKLAFDACADESRIILQHLLAGMNAHINLDLGVAAAQVSPGDRIGELKADFNQINAVLAAQVGAVEAAMAAISPLVGTLSLVDLKSETTVINFNIEMARQAAWTVAERLAWQPEVLRAISIDGLDLAVSIEGRTILYPPDKTQTLAAIREVELQDVRKVIDALTADYPS